MTAQEAKEEDELKLDETTEAMLQAQAKANDFKEKFDAQKPLIQEFTVQIAEKDAKLTLQEKQLKNQKIELVQQLEAQKMVSLQL